MTGQFIVNNIVGEPDTLYVYSCKLYLSLACVIY